MSVPRTHQYLFTNSQEAWLGFSNSTFDEYVSEVSSGHLSWSSATHELDDFWKENAERLGTEGNGKVIKYVFISWRWWAMGQKSKHLPSSRQLVSLLSSSQDPLVLSVAVHDIGAFLKYGGERGRK